MFFFVILLFILLYGAVDNVTERHVSSCVCVLFWVVTARNFKLFKIIDTYLGAIRISYLMILQLSNQIKSNILFHVQPDKILAVKIT